MSTQRPGITDFPLRRIISSRWTDNDIYGHVNNAIYYQYFDSVINQHLIESGQLDIHRGEVVGFIVHSECDYFAPVAYPSDIEIGLAVVKLGSSSVTYEAGLFQPGHPSPCAVARLVHVFVDTGTQRPVPIPASIRQALHMLVREP